jgi:Fic family protein
MANVNAVRRNQKSADWSETGMNTSEKVAESNRIEGITREPTSEELGEHDRFMGLEDLTIGEVEKFVAVYQPNARLRVLPGMNVSVASYVPPKGGEHIREMLGALLHDINDERIDPWHAHIQYETIHPFTDGNGRSGRVIYHWQMRNSRMVDLGFLHAFYYQTLQNFETPPKTPPDSSSRTTRAPLSPSLDSLPAFKKKPQ